MSSSLSTRLEDSDGDTDIDSAMEDAEQSSRTFPVIISANSDPEEARMEAKEIHKYLLAKSFFDCKEFERCAAVFLPSGLPKGSLSAGSPNVSTRSPLKSGKGKSKEPKSATSSSIGNGAIPPPNVLPRLSQKALFLALYAKYMAGEKRKEEDSEMILGPVDRGSAVNKELVGISRSLEGWFATKRPEESTGGWLEYLYGIVLAKGKNEEDAKRWLIRSVHMFPYNWGAWLELNDLLGSMDEVRGSCAGRSHY
jgi:anaphase-promoting complex subunit 8